MNKKAKRDAESRLLKGRALLTVYAPFYGTLLHGLTLTECNEGWNPTMATDGKSIFWNRSFVDEMPDDELLFVEAHEVSHPAHLHHTRRGDRDPLLWNMAGDYVINAALIKAGIGKMPAKGLHDPRFAGYSTEEVYAILKAEQESKQQKQGAGGQNPKQGKGQPSKASGQGQDGDKGDQASDQPGQGEQPSSGSPAGAGDDSGGCGQVIDAAPDAAGKAEAEAEAMTQVKQALSVATRAAGKTPVGLERLVGELGRAKTDWRETLRRFADPSSHTDYSWQRPDRRFGWQDMILPGMVSDGVHHVVIAIDTSASINVEALKAFRTEVQSLLDEGAVDRITVLACDAKVHEVAEFNSGDIVKMSQKGGGGTSFKPVWEWLAAQSDAPAAVVYFTDLDPNDGFGSAPDAPVLWAAYGRPDYLKRKIAQVPFGEVMEVRS